MIRGYINSNDCLEPMEPAADHLDELVWIDLIEPTREEETLIEQKFGLDVPTREEMVEIEISSRLYEEQGVLFMTAVLIAQSATEEPVVGPVSFVLQHDRLITVRYHEPRAFQTFPQRAQQVPVGAGNPEMLLVTLLEAIVDRLADVLERGGDAVAALSPEVFRSTRPGSSARPVHDILVDIGRNGDLVSNMRQSLLSLERLVGFLAGGAERRHDDPDMRARTSTVDADVRSLIDQADFLSQKVTFLLDATLGMISIEQNDIVKIFSMMAVLFLPPTLIASIYGMNFDHMPELDWLFGYPFALLLMVTSMVLAYWYFRRRHWL